MSPVKPSRLRPGDRVGFTSPCGPVKRQNLIAGMEFYRKAGYVVSATKHAFGEWGYLSGTDEERAADLNLCLRDPCLNAIVCSRGGYGASRILHAIDYRAMERYPKIFIGYSDVTAFHLAFGRYSGVVTFHGPVGEMSSESPPPTWNVEQLFKALAGEGPIGEIRNPAEAPQVKSVSPGRATGRMAGGNLSLIAGTIGTPYEIDTRGTVLMLEDVGERPYRIDRMLAQLKMAGKFDDVVGIVIGECVGCCPDPDRPSFTLEQIIDHYFGSIKKPVIYGLACGHGKFKATIPLGVTATVDAEAMCLIIEEEATT